MWFWIVGCGCCDDGDMHGRRREVFVFPKKSVEFAQKKSKITFKDNSYNRTVIDTGVNYMKRTQSSKRVNKNVFTCISLDDITELLQFEWRFGGLRVGSTLCFFLDGFCQGSPLSGAFCDICLMVCESKAADVFCLL